MRHLSIAAETWPLRQAFAISRGAKHQADVVVVTIEAGGRRGRGECVPYFRYGETVARVVDTIESFRAEIERGADRAALQAALPAGAARNALDCALWDLEARQSGQPVWALAGLAAPRPCTTAVTISLDTPAAMAAAAAQRSDCPLLKLKLGADSVLESVEAVAKAAPDAELIADANEAWTLAQLDAWQGALAAAGVTMIEQPLAADADAGLGDIEHAVTICADEACHGAGDLQRLAGRYDMVNIKLDKAGGLTAALALREAASAAGFEIMLGCMVATSLAMAPAMLLAPGARYVDLDGPLYLDADRQPSMLAPGSHTLQPPAAGLWGA